jgi:hypothetical protein
MNCFITPIKINNKDGQKVNIAIIPNNIGFGFGSSNIPIFAKSITNNKGLDPTIIIMTPIRVSLCSFFIMVITELKENEMPIV